MQKGRTTETLKRTFTAITEDCENNGYSDNLNKYVLSKSRYYTAEYIQLTTLEKLVTTYTVSTKSVQLHTFKQRCLKTKFNPR